ncbi:MAG: DUF418 domain-containing protein [Actinobacteria bacterium]|nr:DUF418 domain-containing protein [Actinomycetota bacterium]
MAPVAQTERIVAIDVLRGFALLGILVANISLFDVADIGAVEQAYDDLVVGPAGAPFMFVFLVFVLNKMMAVFSMLFGAGVLLVTERIESRGGSALRVHYVRNVLLAGIGLLHGLLWFGDILLVYGVCALVLYPLRRLSARALLGAGGAVWLLAFVVESGAEEEYVVRALGMMLVGMGLYRSGVINAGRDAAWYRMAMWRSFVVGLPLCTVAWVFASDDGGEAVASDINNMGVPFMALGYVCLVMWFCSEGWLPRARARLAAAGQMALTNYLMQTVLGVLFIGALNEARGERVTAFWMMLATFAIWAVQLAWSVPWLRRFRFGPTEWAWRSATYRKVQRFRV